DEVFGFVGDVLVEAEEDGVKGVSCGDFLGDVLTELLIEACSCSELEEEEEEIELSSNDMDLLGISFSFNDTAPAPVLAPAP
ncbi:hypothetical protein WICPIJ_000124, partial [Wickerhamomyces pijperi]